MRLRNSSKFKIQVTEEDNPDALIKEQVEYQRFEKLNQRVTIITILIPILIGVIIFIGYRDIQTMVSQTHDMSAKELTSMAQNLQSTISNLSIKEAKLEETFGSKLTAIDAAQAHIQNTVTTNESAFRDNFTRIEAALQENSQKTEKALTELQTGKVDKKDIQGDAANFDKKLASVHKDIQINLDKLSSQIQAVDKKFSDESAKTADKISALATRVAECQADIGLLTSDKAERKATDTALKDQAKQFGDQLTQIQRTLEARIEILQAHIRELEKKQK
jgi:Holliday junction resolvasome RuvABC endonuclease subunit